MREFYAPPQPKEIIVPFLPASKHAQKSPEKSQQTRAHLKDQIFPQFVMDVSLSPQGQTQNAQSHPAPAGPFL